MKSCKRCGNAFNPQGREKLCVECTQKYGVCCVCKKVKLKKKFYIDNSLIQGNCSTCKICDKARRMKNHAKTGRKDQKGGGKIRRF